MKVLREDFVHFIDTFFNGRPAPKKSGVTITELIRRKKSVVLADGKLYKITCEEFDEAEKTK